MTQDEKKKVKELIKLETMNQEDYSSIEELNAKKYQLKRELGL